MKRKLMLLLVVLLVLPVLVFADSYVHVNSVYIQNAGANPGHPAGAWWSTADQAAQAEISSSGCAISCIAMVASDNISTNGNPSNPFGVYCENGRSTYAYWDTLAARYRLPSPLGFIDFSGTSALNKAYTIANVLSQGHYPIAKLEVPGKVQHWVLIYSSGSIMSGSGSSDEIAQLLQELELAGACLVPYSTDDPERIVSAPLQLVPGDSNSNYLASTPYDSLFLIHDSTKLAQTGGPYINFTKNSKGATLDHVTKIMVMRRP